MKHKDDDEEQDEGGRVVLPVTVNKDDCSRTQSIYVSTAADEVCFDVTYAHLYLFLTLRSLTVNRYDAMMKYLPCLGRHE